MATITATDTDFEEKVLKNTLPVFVDFFATWCGPCKMAEPVVEELSESYKDKMVFVKINVEENQQLSSKYSIMSIPTTIIFKNGAEVDRQTGFSGKQNFEEMIKKVI